MNILPDSFQEVLSTMKQNKLRTFLTGFAVTWGVMLLVILLSSGQGFQKAMHRNMEGAAGTSKVISVYPGMTQIPYKGYQKGRIIKITLQDAERIAKSHPEAVTDYGMGIEQYTFSLSYGKKGTGDNGLVEGVDPSYLKAKEINVLHGRAINDEDIKAKKKSILIGNKTALDLFNSEKEAIGKIISWKNMNFIVVGVYKQQNGNNFSVAYIPLSTMVNITSGYIYVNELKLICDKLKNGEEGKKLTRILQKELKARYSISPDDDGGVYVVNDMNRGEGIRKIFTGIDIFLWILGFSTLIIGLMGVANIMQVSVNERSMEIGIRKALGAKPGKIIEMILRESVLITVSFGTIGIALGTICMTIIDKVISSNSWASKNIEGMDITIFYDPMISFKTAVAIVIIMILCGALSGYIPAKRTLKISAVDAMRK